MWRESHTHQSSNDNPSTECICEPCIGKSPNKPWSIQCAVAQKLNQWLDKRATLSKFDIGLDPALSSCDLLQQNERERLTRYAAYDCLAMHQLIIKLRIMPYHSTTTEHSHEHSHENSHEQFNYELENISSDDENDSPQPPPAHVHIVGRIRYPREWESSLINEQVPEHIHNEQVHEHIHDEHIHEHIHDEQVPEHIHNEQVHEHIHDEHIHEHIHDEQVHEHIHDEQPPSPPPHTELTLEEQARKRRENRKRTIKQRVRYYRKEIICRHFNRRFTITKVKETLRQHGIPYSAVNKSKSGFTLYIGLKKADNIDEHERIAQHLFSTHHHQHHRHQQNDQHHRHQQNDQQHRLQQHRQNRHQQNDHHQHRY
ncbi:unnamed protein product [Adineta steineri]|uniref:Uncharacterized protein n=1 Tax=Adineta steineri TaxID=433720 RepID=A0A814B850_9BILA|nr:unnamed protein product [Adineta steineri]CAF0923172.1 unnamed protein product [Adineta steineri]